MKYINRISGNVEDYEHDDFGGYDPYPDGELTLPIKPPRTEGRCAGCSCYVCCCKEQADAERDHDTRYGVA